jgi:hypothetical protein
MTRIRNNDRFIPGGSMEPRLNPEIGNTKLNAKLGPNLPRPLIRTTGQDNPLRIGSDSARQRSAGLPGRFNRG